MSRKNEAVNKIVQGSSLYSQLNAYERKVLVALLKVAYSQGAAEERENRP